MSSKRHFNRWFNENKDHVNNLYDILQEYISKNKLKHYLCNTEIPDEERYYWFARFIYKSSDTHIRKNPYL